MIVTNYLNKGGELNFSGIERIKISACVSEKEIISMRYREINYLTGREKIKLSLCDRDIQIICMWQAK